MENKFLEIAGLQIIKGDNLEAYLRSIDMLLAQQNQRLRIATANIQTQRQMIDALQRRLSTVEDKVRPTDLVVDVTEVPQLENN